MLAYIFWHWRPPAGQPAEYEADLADFHRSLALEGATRESVAFSIDPVPWIAVPGGLYEDWYVVADWAGVGRLNAAAVTGARKPPHDRIAARAGGGAGAIYALRAGAGGVGPARFAAWFAKPEGMTYGELDELLAPVRWVGLWQRQMVLGPSPELCLLAPEPVALPSPLDSTESLRRPISGPASS